jgi:hypothetical protein
MEHQLFPYANIVNGVLILIVGFIFHWIGQLISLINWEFATQIGLQEKKMLPEFKVYEHGIAVADVLIGWIYGIVAIGLFVNAPLAYKLAWFPGVILIYHSISFLAWTRNQKQAGHTTIPQSFRITWFLANFVTGMLTIVIAYKALGSI